MVDETVADEHGADADERYKAAKKRVEDLKGFYVHLIVYACVNLGLFVIDLLTGSGWWFFWPLIGWGIAIVLHAMAVFVFDGRWLGPDWEKRRIEKLMNEGGAGR